MRKILTFCAALAVTSGMAVAAVPAPPPELEKVPVTMLVDLGSGQILEQHRPDVSFAPASMTKVMTTFVAFEEHAAGRLPMERRFQVPPEISREWFAKGTSMYLQPLVAPTTDELLHGIMTGSANDASVVLANGYAGSVEAWTYLMNDAARRLGMTHSHYNTPNGWPDEGQTYVSARDLVRLAEAMITRYPSLYKTYSGQKHWSWGDIRLTSHDPTVGVIPGADGIKTGYTVDAGYCFLGSATRDGRRLVMVLAGAKTPPERNAAAKALLEWGFAEWQKRPLYPKGSEVAEARVQDGAARSVPLLADRDIYAVLPRSGGGPISMKLRYEGPLVAPVAKGTRVASLEIKVDGVSTGTVPLYAGKSVEVAGLFDRFVNGVANVFS